jgi:3-oxo-5-alpha-steroid 4-dehydrogenase 1
MAERELFDILLYGWFGLSAAAFVALQFTTAPYGRHARQGWGPSISGLIGWTLMELPALVTFPILLLLSEREPSPVAVALLLMWELHYTHRALVYPVRRRRFVQRMPLAIAVLGLSTNVGINYLNARWLFAFGPELGAQWFGDARFLVGAMLFVSGLLLNVHSDEVLLRLRRTCQGYAVPHGGGFRWVSCPNYLGELIEWAGWALAAWSLPGLAFLVWTASNLVPRAVAHHLWYKERFPEYPPERRALVPFVL